MSKPQDITFASPGDLARHRLKKRVSIAPEALQVPGPGASTFKSRARVRETTERAALYEAPTGGQFKFADDSRPTLPFPPGDPPAYEPPKTPANGIPQTLSSRRFRSEGRGKRRGVEERKRDTIHAAPFCGAQRPGTVFREEASLALPRNCGLGHKAPPKKSHALELMEAALNGRAPATNDDDITSVLSLNHRGGDAACAVWKALWKARERRNAQEGQERGGTLPAFDCFCVADAVLYNDGTPSKWIFSDLVTVKLLRKAQRNVSVDAFRNRCAKVAAGTDVALVIRDEDVQTLSSDPKQWGAIQGRAVVSNVPGTRLKHSFRHDSHLTKAQVRQTGVLKYGDLAKAPAYAPLQSSHLKEALDHVVRVLVRAIEAGAGTRVHSLTSVWALDEKRATRVVNDGVPDAPAMTFERALEVEFLQPLHRGSSDAGSVLGESARAHGAAIGPCPGGFCGLPRIDESEHSNGEPADQTERTFRAMRSAVEECKREACTGEALDFWPDELMKWCLATCSARCAVPRPLLDLPFARPSLYLAYPTNETQCCPGQTVEVRWVCRGPPPALLRIDVEFVPAPGTVEDEFLVTKREVIERVPGHMEKVDWVVPPDLNGANTQAWWRLHLRIVYDDFSDDADTAILASSQPFSVAKTQVLLSHGRLPVAELRPDGHDIQGALGALRVLDKRRAQSTGESRVRRWDKCFVCRNCSEVHADLSARRARYLGAGDAHTLQRDAGLLLLRDTGEGGPKAKLLHAARRRRQHNNLNALSEPRSRRTKSGAEEPPLLKPRRDQGFDANLPRVASTRPRDSPFVASIARKAAVLREEAQAAQWIAAHRSIPEQPQPPRAPPTPTAKLGSSLLNALDGSSHFDAQDSLASVFGTVEDNGDDSLRSVFGGRKPRRRRKKERPPRTYADLLHPWQRLMHDQVEEPEPPPSASNPDALLDSLLDAAAGAESASGLSYY